MQSRKWIPVLVLGGLFALPSPASHAQEAIGKAFAYRRGYLQPAVLPR
jgi:hypothetical protein